MLLYTTVAHAFVFDFDPDEPEDLVLEVILERYLLDEALLSIRQEHITYFPLGYLSELLELAVDVDPTAATVSGHLLTAQQTLDFDANTLTGNLGGMPFRLDESQVLVAQDDIYLDAEAIALLLPIEVEFQSHRMRAVIYADEPLPVMQRLEREARWAGLQGSSESRSYLPLAEWPLRPFTPPSWGLAITSNYQQRALTPHLTISELRMAGDLMHHEASLYATAIDDEVRRVDIQLARNVEHEYLRRYEAGEVRTHGAPLVSRAQSGMGLSLTNRSRTQTSAFLQDYRLEGYAPDGWSAELYRNGDLMDFLPAVTDGRYVFENVLVGRGDNQYDIILYGPRGETRHVREQLFAGAGMLPPGELTYDVTVMQPQRSLVGQYGAPNPQFRDRLLLSSRTDFGLTTHISSGMDVTIRDPEEGEQAAYLGLDLTGSLASMWWQYRHVEQDGAGRAQQIQFSPLLERWAINLGYLTTSGYAAREFALLESQQPSWRADIAVRGPQIGGITWNSDYRREELVSGITRERARLIKNRRMGFARAFNRIDHFRSDNFAITQGTLGGSIRARDMQQFTLGLDYQLGPYRPQSVYGAWNWRYNNNVSSRLRVAQRLSGRESSSISLGIAGDFKRKFRFGGMLGYSEASGLNMAIGIEFGGSYNPHNQQWNIGSERRSQLNDGGVAVLVEMMEDDQPVPQPGVAVQAGHQRALTDQDGIALLAGLDPTMQHDVSLDLASIHDLFIQPAGPGFSVRPRPGVMQPLNYQLVVTGEVEGEVYRLQEGQKMPLRGVRVIAYDKQRNNVAMTRTVFDGLYILDRLPPGQYWIGVAPGDAARIGVDPDYLQEVVIKEGGDLVSAIDFVSGQISD